MHHYVALLRGINLGKRRVQNSELCNCFESCGFSEVSAVLASGNILFASRQKASCEELRHRLALGFENTFGFEVVTFLRTANEIFHLVKVAHEQSFPQLEAGEPGNPQVAFLEEPPGPKARTAVLALATADDWLAVQGQEILWLPRNGISQSELNFKMIESICGTVTVRTLRTVERIAAKLAGP